MSTRETAFASIFEELTGHPPLPWQERLYARFLSERNDNIPTSCNVPTGLGKTLVIAVWLIALAYGAKMPRRLVYVVNRRTVVDQTTREAEKLRAAVASGKRPGVTELAISTLRRQFADNGDWSADPSRPAVICGTVDMIGSRLLFEGYRIGFKSRPLHAGFLGQDALLVHDEAHLEPAFQKLVEGIIREQIHERERDIGVAPTWPRLRIMALSATTRVASQGERAHIDVGRCGANVFELTDDEKKPPREIPNPPTQPIHHVWRRIKAIKTLHLHPCENEKKNLAADVIKHATTPDHLASNHAIVVFLRLVEDVEKVTEVLRKKLRLSRPGEFHPQPLREPDVNLSAHPAPIT